MRQRIVKAGAWLALVLVVSSCARQPLPNAYDPPGFFSGLLHGAFAFFALIGHLFDPEIRIYAFPNSGGWYDFGYIIGLGGIGASSRGR